MTTTENTLPALRKRVAEIVQRQYEDDLTSEGQVADPEYLGERITQALTAELAELHAWRMAWHANNEYVRLLRTSNLPPAEARFARHVIDTSRQMTNKVFAESGLNPPVGAS